jgi:DNA polymerase-3 subunit delta
VNITADQLSVNLSKKLESVYIVTGDEPLLVGEAVDAIRAVAREAGYTEREVYVSERGFDWKSLAAGMDNLSLFSTQRLVEIRIPTGKPGKEGGAALTELVDRLPPDTLILVILPKLDKRALSSKWVTSLSNAGVMVTVKPVTTEKLPAWLAGTLRKHGLTFDDDVVALLAERLEGNLLAAQQEIGKLALLASDGYVSLETVQKSVSDGTRFDVFQLADAAIGQQAARAARILQGLRREGTAAPLVLWALLREVTTLVSLWARVSQGESSTQAMNSMRIWRNRQPMIGRALARMDATSIRLLLDQACAADRIVKGARLGQPWNVLMDLTMTLAASSPPSSTLQTAG